MHVPARAFGKPVPDHPVLCVAWLSQTRCISKSRGTALRSHGTLVPGAGIALAGDLPGGDVEGGEERFRSLACVIVAAPFRLGRVHGKHFLACGRAAELATSNPRHGAGLRRWPCGASVLIQSNYKIKYELPSGPETATLRLKCRGRATQLINGKPARIVWPYESS